MKVQGEWGWLVRRVVGDCSLVRESDAVTVTKHLRPVVFERSFNEAKNYCRRCVGAHRQEREEGKRGHGGRQWLGDMVRHPDPNRHQSYYDALQGMFDVHVRCVHKLLPLPQLSWPWGSGSKQKCRVKSVRSAELVGTMAPLPVIATM